MSLLDNLKVVFCKNCGLENFVKTNVYHIDIDGSVNPIAWHCTYCKSDIGSNKPNEGK